jgi:hypothetical protein
VDRQVDSIIHSQCITATRGPIQPVRVWASPLVRIHSRVFFGYGRYRTSSYTRTALTQKLRRVIDEGIGYGLALEGISAAEVARRMSNQG